MQAVLIRMIHFHFFRFPIAFRWFNNNKKNFWPLPRNARFARSVREHNRDTVLPSIPPLAFDLPNLDFVTRIEKLLWSESVGLEIRWDGNPSIWESIETWICWAGNLLSCKSVEVWIRWVGDLLSCKSFDSEIYWDVNPLGWEFSKL